MRQVSDGSGWLDEEHRACPPCLPGCSPQPSLSLSEHALQKVCTVHVTVRRSSREGLAQFYAFRLWTEFSLRNLGKCDLKNSVPINLKGIILLVLRSWSSISEACD